MDTGMLMPKKSLLAVFGLTPRTEKVQRLTSLVPCTNCSLRGCRYRRAPYGRPLPRTDAVRMPDAPPAARPALTEGARYSTGTSALQRWAQQRLRLQVGADGTVDARFKYEGTTCSNMGHPLAFEYRVRLTSREEGYRIVDATCAPAPEDTGHELMCEYLDRGPALMDAIATERPLVGRPLDDVLTWQRGRDSSGCYCTAEAREHKWGLALEVLHYALLQGGGHDTTPGRTAP
jgi:hypothetical protein